MTKTTNKIVLTGLFIAIGIILPQLFHPINLGNVISPMHFAVLLCGLMLGFKYGLACGIITPLLTGILFQRPDLFPTGISMAIELGVYGLVSGLLYEKLKFKNYLANLYSSLIIAMIVGRFGASLINAILYVSNASKTDFITYINILFVVGLPGIVLQLLIIPPIVSRLNIVNNEKELN